MKYRRYSESTIRTYKELTITYLRFIKPKKATDEVGDDVERFTNDYILPRRLSFSYQNQLDVKRHICLRVAQERVVEPEAAGY
jgi:hypothetical protein